MTLLFRYGESAEFRVPSAEFSVPGAAGIGVGHEAWGMGHGARDSRFLIMPRDSYAYVRAVLTMGDEI